MDDIELYRLSAAALGFKTKVENYGLKGNRVFYQRDGSPKPDWCEWAPFENDAQAFALLKQLELDVNREQGVEWEVNNRHSPHDSDGYKYAQDKDLNRAIVRCAAKMQASRDGDERNG